MIPQHFRLAQTHKRVSEQVRIPAVVVLPLQFARDNKAIHEATPNELVRIPMTLFNGLSVESLKMEMDGVTVLCGPDLKEGLAA